MVKFHKKAKAVKKTNNNFTIDCTHPVDDNVILIGDFQKFLTERIKVEGKQGNLGDSISVSAKGSSIHVDTTIPFSKRYLKYLTKKYLKKQKMREYLRVVSSQKNGY